MEIDLHISGDKNGSTKEITLYLPCGDKRARMIFGISNLSLDSQEQHNQIREEAICILLRLKSAVEEQLPLRG